jgi:uroporphyrinogen-III synthase
MRVLVTRPEADAAALVAALEARGHEALAQPLLTIEPAVPEPPLDLAGVQALLFTSANGVRAFADVSQERGLPVFAVGDASAEAARAARFAKVESASGDVEDLARLVKDRLDPGAGPLLHGAGGSLGAACSTRPSRCGSSRVRCGRRWPAETWTRCCFSLPGPRRPLLGWSRATAWRRNASGARRSV